MIKCRQYFVKEATCMLLLLRSDFAFKIKGRTRSYVSKEGILKIDSRYVYWEDIMSALAYELNKIDFCLICGKRLDDKNKNIKPR